MLPEFKDVIKAVAIAGLVLGAALGFASQAKAGPLDQGPHILVGYGYMETFTAIPVYDTKEECLAARDDLRKQLTDAHAEGSRKYRTALAVLACIPGRNT